MSPLASGEDSLQPMNLWVYRFHTYYLGEKSVSGWLRTMVLPLLTSLPPPLPFNPENTPTMMSFHFHIISIQCKEFLYDICHLSNQHAFKIMLMLHVFFIKHLKVSARLYLFIFKILFAGDGGLYIWTKHSAEILFCLLIRIWIFFFFYSQISELLSEFPALYIHPIIFVCLLWCVECF